MPSPGAEGPGPRNAQQNALLNAARARLSSRHANDRLRAIDDLRRSGTREALQLLAGALRDRLSYVGATAAAALIEHATPEIADIFIRHFEWASADGTERDPGCSVRNELAVALGNMLAREAEEVIRLGLRTVQVEMVGNGLMDTGIALRANCALALAQLNAPGAVIDISLLLFDAAPSGPGDTLPARRAAARALGILGDTAASVPLIMKLSNPETEDPDVLVDCMDSLAVIGEPRALEFIVPYLKGLQPFLAAGAAMALARTHRPEALSPLVKALDDADADRVDALAVALAALRLPEARASLLQRITDGRRPLRIACIRALQVFPDDEVQQRLDFLSHNEPDAKVRAAAAECVRR